MDDKTLAQLFDMIADDFEGCTWSEDTRIEFGNTLIKMAASVSDMAVCESILNALATLADSNQPVAKGLKLDILTDDMQGFDCQCTEYLLEILSFTGDERYSGIITECCRKFTSLDAQEYLQELKKRRKLYSSTNNS